MISEQTFSLAASLLALSSLSLRRYRVVSATTVVGSERWAYAVNLNTIIRYVVGRHYQVAGKSVFLLGCRRRSMQ